MCIWNFLFFPLCCLSFLFLFQFSHFPFSTSGLLVALCTWGFSLTARRAGTCSAVARSSSPRCPTWSTTTASSDCPSKVLNTWSSSIPWVTRPYSCHVEERLLLLERYPWPSTISERRKKASSLFPSQPFTMPPNSSSEAWSFEVL